MKKKRYNFCLDEEPTEIVRQWLTGTGQSFSGFLNFILSEMAKDIKGQPMVFDKKVSEMTLKEYSDMVTYWLRRTDERHEEECV